MARMNVLWLILMVVVLGTSLMAEQVLYTFTGGTDGAYPYAGLVSDSNGRLYGTTTSGGAYGCGVVFEVSQSNAGAWVQTVLHQFNPGVLDGCSPFAELTVDSAGNLYGTTQYGGSSNSGTVFEVQPGPSGWNEKILHNFGATSTDGINPYGGVILDKAGNLFGTTYYCGKYSAGTVFKLVKQSNGTWPERIIHHFNYTAGGEPRSTLAVDSVGRLYGTTEYGGAYQHGTVFRMTPTATGGWGFKVLHVFNPSNGDGFSPYAGVVLDTAGNIYGTTLNGGYGWGTVYRLSQGTNGAWKAKLIHIFVYGNDGINPYGSLAIDPAGNLYGTAWQSLFGNIGGAGIVFKLTPSSSGSWSETVLFNFVSGGGGNPYSGVIVRNGVLYGTTYFGGIGVGVVFSL
jgi:uncharacterized repeat protein (TIGR03803 family)